MNGVVRSCCTQCGAPLPPLADGLAVQCRHCRAQVHVGAGSRLRELVMIDGGEAIEAADLLAQHLALRQPGQIEAMQGGQPRLAPFWSVITAGGDLFTGPATREQSGLLSRLALPSLPARPLAPDETPPAQPCAVDIELEDFLDAAGAAPAARPLALERAWLVWVPVRFWRARAGGQEIEAVTVADTLTPVVSQPGTAAAGIGQAGKALAPLAVYTAAIAAAALLLPLPFYPPVALALLAMAMRYGAAAAPRDHGALREGAP